MYYISKNYKGIHCTAIAGNQLPNHIYSTFSHAIQMYGFLLNEGDKLTGNEWIERISKSYDTINNPRLVKVIDSIKIAMNLMD